MVKLRFAGPVSSGLLTGVWAWWLASREPGPNVLSSREEEYLFLGRRPETNVGMGIVLVLSRCPVRSELVSTMEELCRSTPRLRQRVEALWKGFAGFRWVDVPDFDASKHVQYRIMEEDNGPMSALTTASSVISRDFDPDAPPWTLVILQGMLSGGAIAVLVLHHAIVDGDGLARLIAPMLLPPGETAVVDRTIIGPPEGAVSPSRGGTLGLWGQRSARRLTQVSNSAVRIRAPNVPSKGCRSSVRRYIGRPRRRGSGPGAGRQLFAHSLESASWKHAALQRGAGVNELFVSVLACTLSRYFGFEGQSLRYVMPLSLRSFGRQVSGGNQSIDILAAVTAPQHVPSDLKNLARRHRELIHEQVHAQRNANAAANVVEAIVRLLPGSLQAQLLCRKYSQTDFVASKVSAPAGLEMSGVSVNSMFGFTTTLGNPLTGVLAEGPLRTTLTLNIDLGQITETGRFCQGFREVLKEVFGSDAGELLV